MTGFRIGAVSASRWPTKGAVLWLTGMSGAGKTTLALALKRALELRGLRVAILDGDELRSGLCSDLGFSEDDKREQIRRTAEVARIVALAGSVAIVALISPYRESRQQARAICGGNIAFTEIYVKCSESERRRRDPKGLYARLDAGEISGMSGVDAPYEEPDDPAATVMTAASGIEDCVEAVLESMDRASWER